VLRGGLQYIKKDVATLTSMPGDREINSEAREPH